MLGFQECGKALWKVFWPVDQLDNGHGSAIRGSRTGFEDPDKSFKGRLAVSLFEDCQDFLPGLHAVQLFEDFEAVLLGFAQAQRNDLMIIKVICRNDKVMGVCILDPLHVASLWLGLS